LVILFLLWPIYEWVALLKIKIIVYVLIESSMPYDFDSSFGPSNFESSYRRFFRIILACLLKVVSLHLLFNIFYDKSLIDGL
jgi:hypothetical protein